MIIPIYSVFMVEGLINLLTDVEFFYEMLEGRNRNYMEKEGIGTSHWLNFCRVEWDMEHSD